MKKKTTAEFIEQARLVHGELYDYNEVAYVNNSTKVDIICRKHGVFRQAPNSHLRGRGCPVCSGNKTLTSAAFVEKARGVHGGRYSYDLAKYTGVASKVTITCKTHGDFQQRPDAHLRGKGCLKCGNSVRRWTTSEFIERASLVHGGKYSYDLVQYVNKRTQITITCPVHGNFQQNPGSHMAGRGCVECGNASQRGHLTKTTGEFVAEARSVHGDKYGYEAVEYVHTQTKITIICPVHGEFQQTPSAHIIGQGCKACCGMPSDRDVVYIHRADGIFRNGVQVYKIGMTSKRLKTSTRRKQLERALGSTLTPVLYLTLDPIAIPATTLEQSILSYCDNKVDWGGLAFDGSTEYRAIDDLRISELVNDLEVLRFAGQT